MEYTEQVIMETNGQIVFRGSDFLFFRGLFPRHKEEIKEICGMFKLLETASLKRDVEIMCWKC